MGNISKFERLIDSSYPREWDRWQLDGTTWVIQDLPPEDDDKAIDVLLKHFLPDEIMSNCTGIATDPEGRQSLESYWRKCLSQRMSLGCYTLENGEKKLVALNVCIVKCKDDEKVNGCGGTGKAWKDFCISYNYIDTKVDPFKVLNTDRVLHAMGLCVKKEYRGAKLGAKLLASRKPLSKYHDITGTATIFTGPASQKLAAKVGFVTAAEVSLRELADNGMAYPRSDHVIKYMVKKFD